MGINGGLNGLLAWPRLKYSFKVYYWIEKDLHCDVCRQKHLFPLCLFQRKKVEYIHISSCLLWQAKDLRWVEWPFSHHYFYYLLIFYFKILCSRENSPKLSLSAKTHGDSAIWVISDKHHISLNEEHLELLQDLLKLFHRKWLLSKM